MEAINATMATTKRHPSRDILRARRACPGCGVSMTYHALCYKHRCRGGPDAKRTRRLEQRIEKRLRPAGGEERLEQRAGKEERIEQQGETAPLEEEAVGLAAFAQA